MLPPRTRVRLLTSAAAALLAAPLVTAVGAPDAAAATSGIRGVNWADARDNYVAGWVIPTGLTASDTYATVRSKAAGILGGFQSQLGANTVRLPVNPQSVSSSWWASYKGAIDEARARGMSVVLGYWEADTSKDGTIDDTAAWNAMWDTVVTDYGSDSGVSFEPMNEPFGYSLSAWTSVASGWLSRHASVPRGRVLVSGTGYDDDVTGVCAASALSGTLLALHFYGYWANDTTRSAWTTNLSGRIGSCGSRTVIDEAGAPMTTGLQYSGGPQDGNTSTAYFAATTDYARANGIGLVYWPGLRSGDTYSITRQSGSGLAVNNASGVTQLRWGWGL
ncbi:cellulase (glycosyl hydrolase family 5) [Motilibacter rhizosphaerae]|uniref:Cellulase (Glycosyl hydrolase family 5) n=1 Tax=Motilibacter rhizosphaerae TaxID=598652 RepID=A0A4Q7NV52_9ACTN|nr:cellulase family glycosylhydrolase [Motilibacter rhizosphaerae]RZS91126.1 cellulase (glycosyl hydrolase family 5) [Motilibacter rhizosphaerae]